MNCNRADALPGADTDPDRLVLYGLLRRGLPDFRRLGLDRALVWLGPCSVRGTLYDLGPYPGFLPDGRQLVRGDLFALHDRRVLEALDAFEDYRPGDPAGSLYLRRSVALCRPAGKAWIYVYNRDVGAAAPVASGDWLAHLRARRGRGAARQP